jgi:phage host-nuclease inhibitor protein Gam
VRKRFQKQVDKLVLAKDEAFDKLQLFAETNPEMFEQKKSLELSHGKIGFRTGTPKLKLLKSFNWDRVVEKLEQHLPSFVRTKKEADKEKLLSCRDEASTAEKFKLIGIEVVQDETFFVEPKTEEVSV